MKIKSVYLITGISVCIVALFFISVLFAKLLSGGKNTFSLGEEIGVLEVKGLIIDSHEYIVQLNNFRDNKRIKAVVLRIDSPGGVVGPTQEIYEEVKKFVIKKPIIVSMGSVATSGGYYIAAPASMIVANPGTITGSIGVLMKLSNIQGLLGKVGLNSFVLKSGRFKDSGSPLRSMTREDRKILQDVINSMHGQFVTAVSKGRKIPVEDVIKIADGRIFSGEQALQEKLVDRLGNFQDAVAEAARMTGIKAEPKLIYPPKKKMTLLDYLIEGSSNMIANKLNLENGISVRYEIPD
jgi:protease IV